MFSSSPCELLPMCLQLASGKCGDHGGTAPRNRQDLLIRLPIPGNLCTKRKTSLHLGILSTLLAAASPRDHRRRGNSFSQSENRPSLKIFLLTKPNQTTPPAQTILSAAISSPSSHHNTGSQPLWHEAFPTTTSVHSQVQTPIAISAR